MATVAIYSLKGGVGKTTFSINLAWAAAKISKRRTLIWDLDPQAASTYLMAKGPVTHASAQAIFARSVDAMTLVRQSHVEGVDLLAADTSLRGLDHFFFELGKKRRLAKLLAGLSKHYDRIILDCPPGLTQTSEQVLRAADLVVVPVIPAPLSQRALTEVVHFLDRQRGRHAPILPVYSMVDRRRSLHRAALEEKADWPVVPMASSVEQMSVRKAPLGEFEPHCPAAKAFTKLWTGIERKIRTAA
ncbi:ParA family protein [Rhizorhapis suberifaciens]|uniref:Cellulose biosynthesis protein BcsQ n=1 Tax=Rhizorhapis suberifaciens TaxID=13656 RepID=A0A840HSY0_9SPHN|nr:ParA family protein [Rhizorhapis suberifaciens]MBB4640690.1 cellulose biosynthesis protein BcsQ [Rhizorhapis suberifaciens]